jgi:uncharacterized membrane protein YagU involved in acid resistance
MMALRAFDEHYAPRTIAKTRKDPAEFMINVAEHVTGTAGAIPKGVEKTAALATSAGYGMVFGVLYGVLRGRGRHRSALLDGALLGTAVYAAGHCGWLPLLGLGRPTWKQGFPEVAGELIRHVAYGVATAAAYDAADETM